MKHELWEEDGGAQLTFCFAGPRGEGARKSLGPDARLIWAVEADSHFEAMTLYYGFMDWGEYKTDYEEDKQPYPEEWAQE